jgi:lipid-A-disaccharide synthase
MKALMVAGEASGDIYGASLASVLKNRIPDLYLAGMGGDRMQASGVQLLTHYGHVAVVGVFEVFAKLASLRRAYTSLSNWIEENSPEFVVLIDFPDFNFRLARFLRKKKIKVFYFVSPQIWAWRKNRIHFLKDHINLMISILPFEKTMYDRAGVPTVYVGHPLVEIVHNELQAQTPFAPKTQKKIGLMPGSRDTEVRRHLPILLKTSFLLKDRFDTETILIWAPFLNERDYDTEGVRLIKENRYSAMQSCDFLFVASGTSTLETAILGVPFVIVYRVGPLSWQLGKFLVRVPYYGLVNWIAQQKIVPEFIQDQMKPELLCAEARSFLESEKRRSDMRQHLREIVESLGPAGAMDRAAEEIVKRL